MGFKTGTLISPQDLRQYVFPWQKRLAEIVHAQNKPFLLHACGNLGQIMDDLIDDVGIDAKHSFEDGIQPVAEAKKLYGDRIAVLGGIDVDFLCRRSTPSEFRILLVSVQGIDQKLGFLIPRDGGNGGRRK